MKRYEHNFGKNPQGALSTVSGYATETTNFGETAFGILNKSTIDKNNFTTPEVVSSSTATLFSVGNGTDTDNRKNIIELKADGTVFISGVGGYDGTNPGDSKDISKELQSVHDDIDNINLDIDRIDSDIDSIHVEQDSDLVYTFIVKGENRGTINIPRDQFLKDVNYDEETNILEFLFIIRNEENEEEQKVVKIDMTDLEDIYTNGDGLNLENKQFSIKIDADTQPYINVGPNGLKIIGINEALDKKVSWDESKKVITLPADGSISALRNNGLEGGVLVCQRTYDDGATYVTEIGTTKNNLTLNSIERPKIDFAGGASENVAYESEVKSLQDRMSTAETDIDNLEGRMDAAEGDIDTIQSDLSELTGDGEGSVQDQIKTALEDYLPLSGGTMTGNITFGSESEDYTGGIIISGKSDQDLVNAVGGTTTIDSIREGLATEDALNEYKTSNDEKIQSIEDKLDQEIEAGNTDKETIDNYTVNGHKISENPVLTKTDVGLNQVDNVQQIPMSMKGQAGGVAELDANGKVPSSQLELLALGEVAGTAYEGNKGAANKAAIGTNIYTGANYISKETNLTEAVLQLDEEIKATNDNLTLEHENAEATYAKKTELGNYLPLSGGTLTGNIVLEEGKSPRVLTNSRNWNNNSDNYVCGLTWYDPENTTQLGGICYYNSGATDPENNSWIGISANIRNVTAEGSYTYADKEGDYLFRISATQGVYYNTHKLVENTELADYLTKTDASNTYQPKGNYLTTIPSEYVTDSELNAKGYQTEAQVAAKVASLVDSAPETLDTLNELAAALGDDPNFATTVTNQIASKQDKLVSGTNIKTINNQSIVGSGNIEISDKQVTASTADSSGGIYRSVLATPQSTNDFTGNPASLPGVRVKMAESGASVLVISDSVQTAGESPTNDNISAITDRGFGVVAGTNDRFMITAGGHDDSGFGLIAMLDNANDPIYVCSVESSANQIGHLITLLDRSGNQKFNDVTANTFIGNLQGNAATATKATQDASGNVITDTYAKKSDIVAPTVKAASGTLTLWTGTQTEYNDIATKDPNTLYFILES